VEREGRSSRRERTCGKGRGRGTRRGGGAEVQNELDIKGRPEPAQEKGRFTWGGWRGGEQMRAAEGRKAMVNELEEAYKGWRRGGAHA
jgi:hypothetical protein